MITSIFSAIVSLIIMILFFVFSDINDTEVSGFITFMFVVFLITTTLSVALYFQAVGVYPSLKAREAHVLALKSEIIRIKKSFYNKGEQHSLLVGGSLDNMKQSTNLSLYISKYATSKANFAYSLTKYKTACKIKPYWILGSNIAMDCPAIEKVMNPTPKGGRFN